MEEARLWKAHLETEGVADTLRHAVEDRLSALLSDPLGEEIPAALRVLELADRLGLTFNLWKTQTLFAQICRQHLSMLLERCVHEETVAHQVTLLRRLGEQLDFYAVEDIPLETWEKS